MAIESTLKTLTQGYIHFVIDVLAHDYVLMLGIKAHIWWMLVSHPLPACLFYHPHPILINL